MPILRKSLEAAPYASSTRNLIEELNTIPPEPKHKPSCADGIDYRFLAENCADMLAHVGNDLRICYISTSVFSVLGWRPEEMIGKDFGDFVLSKDISVLDEFAAARRMDHAINFHVRARLRKKDQTWIWISVNGRCVHDPATGGCGYVLSMRDITDRIIFEEKLSALAMTDALTELWNRRAFDQALRREWKRTMREESQLSLLLLDLDNFKLLNDEYGHQLGDECLVRVASAVNDAVRATDIVCRWGGDEIAIILTGTDYAGALKAAEKIRSAVEIVRLQATNNASEWVSVTASIGVATAAGEQSGMVNSPQNLLQAADKALYKSKHDRQERLTTIPLFAPDKRQIKLKHSVRSNNSILP